MNSETEAERLLRGSLVTCEASYGPDSKEALEVLHRLSRLYLALARWEDAEGVLRRLAATSHPDFRGPAGFRPQIALELGRVLRKLGRDREALAFLEEAAKRASLAETANIFVDIDTCKEQGVMAEYKALLGELDLSAEERSKRLASFHNHARNFFAKIGTGDEARTNQLSEPVPELLRI